MVGYQVHLFCLKHTNDISVVTNVSTKMHTDLGIANLVSKLCLISEISHIIVGKIVGFWQEDLFFYFYQRSLLYLDKFFMCGMGASQ